MSSAAAFLLVTGGRARASSRRPAPVQQPPLPPFDAPDGPPDNNQVATSPPPEFQPTPASMTADFDGITIPGNYTWTGFTPTDPPTTPPVGAFITMTDGPYKGLVIPFLVGANSTPPTMLMSPMLIMYPRPVQDAWLRESAQRSYRDVVIAPDVWNAYQNGRSYSPDEIVAWCQYVMGWGNRIVLWRGQALSPDPYFRACVAAGCVHRYIVCKEADGQMPAESLPPIIDQALADGPGIPIGAHFTANYPIGFPNDTFLDGGPNRGSWSKYKGKPVFLAWQADNDDSAGRQAAMLYYARIRVQLGGVAGDGQPSDCEIVLFEIMATSELFDRSTELYAKLRTLECLWAPNGGNPGLTGNNGGFGNGASLPDGTPIPS